MTDHIKDAVRVTFGPNAGNYVANHTGGGDLARMIELARLTGREQVLDVATGGGQTALAFAAGAAHVTAFDLTPEMLEQARRQAVDRGVHNISFREGDAEQLPFADGSFDLVTCRIAAHHFPHVDSFCREAARVLRPDGLLLVLDNYAPEDDELDSFINGLDKLRDPSHFRAYRLSEWERLFAGAGLTGEVAERFTTRVDVAWWVARISLPEAAAAEVRRRLAEAPERVKAHFQIDATHFNHFKAIIAGRKLRP